MLMFINDILIIAFSIFAGVTFNIQLLISFVLDNDNKVVFILLVWLPSDVLTMLSQPQNETASAFNNSRCG
jgi:hypothetical protein